MHLFSRYKIETINLSWNVKNTVGSLSNEVKKNIYVLSKNGAQQCNKMETGFLIMLMWLINKVLVTLMELWIHQ